MNKLEEAAREKYFDQLWDFLADFLGEEYTTDEGVNIILKYMTDFTQQNTLTLDSKIKDGEPVDEPKFSALERISPAVNTDAMIEEYQSLPTIRERLKELEELREEVFFKSKHIKGLAKGIEQLTKERDELKEDLIRESALSLRRLNINMKIEEQLQDVKKERDELRVKTSDSFLQDLLRQETQGRVRMRRLYAEKIQQIEQLTKERDNLREIEKSNGRTFAAMEKQLQTERQKVKDMEKGLKRIKEYGQIESIDALIDELLNQ